MRIVLFGAHKVGKTALAEELLENLPNYTLEIEPYYQLESAGYVFSENPIVEDFIEQYDYAIDLLVNSRKNVIFDRCPIDLLAYIQVLDPKGNIQLPYEQTLSLLPEIDLFVFVPIEEDDIIPAHLIELPKLRRKVNDLLGDWIDDFGIEAIVVNGPLSNRRDQVLARILR